MYFGTQIVPLMQVQVMAKVYLSIGSNMGNRLKMLLMAFHSVRKQIGLITAFSSVYETAPWGFESEQPFYNQVLEVDTDLTPRQILQQLITIELEAGRKRDGTSNYSDRTLDIDILLYNHQIVNQKDIIIPHPRMHVRRFVLQPLAEIAPKLTHPLSGIDTHQMLSQLTDNEEIKIKVTRSDFANLIEPA
jgi:2-amino-4-hydroxy-6-hydroxymethyldihydropteridine diphosphokinase